MKPLHLITALLTLASWSPLLAQSFKITEVLPAPIVGDPMVEITNLSDLPLDTSDARILIGGQTHERLPSVLLAPGAFLRLHIGVSGTNSATDLFLPDVGPLLLQAQSVALFQGEIVGDLGVFFENPDHIIDFMQWGAPHQAAAGIAEAAWIWFFASTFIPAPFPTESLAWRGQGNQPQDWFRDTSPTLGGPSVQASAQVSALGIPCTPAALGPQLWANSVPALGNKDFRLDAAAQSVGQPALLFVGLDTTTIPVFGGSCFFHVDQIFKTVNFIVPSGVRQFPLPIPEDPSLVGVQVVFQLAVINGFGIPGQGISLSSAAVINI